MVLATVEVGRPRQRVFAQANAGELSAQRVEDSVTKLAAAKANESALLNTMSVRRAAVMACAARRPRTAAQADIPPCGISRRPWSGVDRLSGWRPRGSYSSLSLPM